MGKSLYAFIQKYYLVSGVTFILCIIPFFWIKPGEMDLGGDGTRLYFYDPGSFLKNYIWYGVSPLGFGNVEPHYDMLPFVSLLIVIKFFFHSSYLLIAISNILKFAGGFIFVYLIIKILQKPVVKKTYIQEISAILGGLFYIFMPPIQGNYERALIIQDQNFLNPLLFYLFLRYTITRRVKFLWILLLVTVIFAHNFSWVAAPALFSFYPVVFLALYCYTRVVLKKSFPWKGYILSFFIFILLHAFHLVPTLRNFLGGAIGSRVFYSSDMHQLFDYVSSVLSSSFLLDNLLVSPQSVYLHFISFIVPGIIILGLLFKKKENKTLIIFTLCFIITLFFVTGNITHFGSILYTKLFFLPGFSMFRDFRGKWFTSYTFFYSLVFALSLYAFLQKVPYKVGIGISILLTSILLLYGYPLWNGSVVSKVLFQSNGVNNTSTFDKNYRDTLKTISSLPDGKILSLPFSDYDYQVVAGTNNGAYVGVAPFPYLTGKETFSGYGDMIPLADAFYSYNKVRNYKALNELLDILDIQYIYYNSDPKIYDTYFPLYPYQYVREYLPNSQKEYIKYLSHMNIQPLLKTSFYTVYKRTNVKKHHIYAVKNISVFTNQKNLEKAIAGNMNANTTYLTIEDCKKVFGDSLCRSDIPLIQPDIQYKKISPVMYKITIKNLNSKFLLVLSEGFSNKWQITSQSKNTSSWLEDFIPSQPIVFPHFVVNGYANGWIISPSDFNNKRDITLVVEMIDQKIFYLSLIFSSVILLFFLLSIPLWFKNRQL